MKLSLFLFLIAISLLTLLQGEVPFQFCLDNAFLRLSGESTLWNPLLDERLPRLILLLTSGASLALSGVLVQALFHNPLAAPSTLGVTIGSQLFVLCLFLLEWHINYPALLPFAAFLGSFIILFLIYGVSRSFGPIALQSLILTGIALTTLLHSFYQTILYTLRHQWSLLQTISEWQAGSTSHLTWQDVHMQLPLALVGITTSLFYRKELNLLSLGEDEAKNLGVEVEQVRWRLFLSIAALVGGVSATIGTLPFYGFVLPHLLRSWKGPDHNFLVPLSIAIGGLLLTTIDFLLRFSRFQFLTIGNLSALLGGLTFVLLLTFQQRRVFN